MLFFSRSHPCTLRPCPHLCSRIGLEGRYRIILSKRDDSCRKRERCNVSDLSLPLSFSLSHLSPRLALDDSRASPPRPLFLCRQEEEKDTTVDIMCELPGVQVRENERGGIESERERERAINVQLR